MSGAEAAGFRFLLGPHIDGPYGQPVAELGALDDAKTHPTAAEHGDAVARPHLGGVERGADAL
jgi:hypothetical protein